MDRQIINNETEIIGMQAKETHKKEKGRRNAGACWKDVC